MGENNGNALTLLTDACTEFCFFPTVKRAEWFVKQQKIVVLCEYAGKVKAVEFTPAQGKW